MGRYLWFYGNDPARDQDFNAFWIQGLAQNPANRNAWNPLPRRVYRYGKKDYLPEKKLMVMTDPYLPQTRKDFFDCAYTDPNLSLHLREEKMHNSKTDSH